MNSRYDLADTHIKIYYQTDSEFEQIRNLCLEENNWLRYNYTRENLIIEEAFVNQGPILKRMRPRAQGRAFAIQKKMAHLTIRVTEL